MSKAASKTRRVLPTKSPSDRNLFLVLGKYVERQDENLLTQSLVLLFNRVGGFRRGFCALLASRIGRPLAQNLDALVARSQVHRAASGRNLISDLEIGPPGSQPVLLVEVKLNAPLGRGQIRKYSRALARLTPPAHLVVITKNEIQDELYWIAPSRTVWLSWSLVAELARRESKRAPRLEKLLVEDFLEMIETKHVPMLPPMKADEWRRLPMFSRFAVQGPARVIHMRFNTVAAIELALQRLAALRDGAWEAEFRKSDGWRPYLQVYKHAEGKTPCTVLEAGYWRRIRRHGIRWTWISLELECRARPRLDVCGGWVPARGHADYDDGDWYTDLAVWTPRETERVFKMAIHDAADAVNGRLRSAARRFRQSRFAVRPGKTR